MSKRLEVRDLSFSYGSNRVFSDINLEASQADIVCLMGPNGCGKTTLLDSILALKKPQSGRILLCGRPVGDMKRHEIAQTISYVPQIHEVSFPYTVREMVLMGRTAYTGAFNRPSKEDEIICDEAMCRIGIDTMADRPYSMLSGGEIKLVLLARALGQKTPLLLMDEPTAHLDFKNELLFLETVAGLCAEEDITVVIATHSPDHAFYFDRKGLSVKAAMMSCGGIVRFGRPDEVISAENIYDVYGVKAKIIKDTDEAGRAFCTVMLLETA